MTDEDQPRPFEPSAGSGPTPQRATEHGAGRILAAVVVVALAFGAGLIVGQSRPGAASPGATASPVAVSSPAHAPTPSTAPTPSPPAPTTDPTATLSASPTASPTDQPETPAPTPDATSTPGPTTPVVAAPTVPAEAPDDFGLFWEALGHIRERYVGRSELDDQDLTYGAISGLIESLGDTGHSVFLTREDLVAERESLRGRLTGIGAVLGEQAGRPIIVSVLPDGPADRGGVRSGDRILAVDGRPVGDLAIDQLTRRIRGAAGTTVTLTLLHPGDDAPVEISLVRERIQIRPASWAMVPGTRIADVRLIQFSEGAGEALTEALREAIDAGAESIVLDLRSNPGGLVNEAVTSASQFLSEGTVYVREDADGNRTPVNAEPGGVATELPVVVLIDLGTASSAEIVAGAIQDNDRGPVVGTRSFGTGTVLNTIELSDGSAVRLGVERWLTPEGRTIFEEGIAPSEVVELEPSARPLEPREVGELTPEGLAASGDAQLLRALELLGAA